MPPGRQDGIASLLKAISRARHRGIAEVASLGWQRLDESRRSEDELLFFHLDSPGPGGESPTGLSLLELNEQDAPRYVDDIGTETIATFRRRLSETTRCFALDSGGSLVHTTWVTTGSAWTREIRRFVTPRPDEAYLYESYTRPDARGAGLFRLALIAISAHLAEAGSDRVWIGAENHNAASQRAIARAGFEFGFGIRFRRRWGRLALDAATGPLAARASDLIGVG